MKRYSVLAVLMLLSPSAYADSISFSVGGRRIHIEAPRYCRSTSCASVSISGGYRSRNRYDDDDRYQEVTNGEIECDETGVDVKRAKLRAGY